MKNTTTMLKAGLIAAAVAATGTFSAYAGDKYLETVEQRLERLERELNVMRGDAKGKDILTEDVPLYVKPKSKFLTNATLSGRLQWQAGYVLPTSNGLRAAGVVDDNYSTQEIRRGRIGFGVDFMGDFHAFVEGTFTPGNAQLNEGYIQYRGMEAFQPLVGYVKPTYGYEQNTSSAKLLTIERSNLTNTLSGAQQVGAVIEGETGVFFYSAGIFNNVRFGNNTLPAVNVGNVNSQDYAYNISTGVDLTDMVGFKLKLRGDYVNAQAPTGGAPQYVFTNSVAGSISTGFGPFDLSAEFMAGLDGNLAANRDASVYGFYVMPSYYVVPKKVQLVGQYTWMDADGTRGVGAIRLPGRYSARAFSPIPPATTIAGDNFMSIYGGVNYYIHGDDLKVMFGASYDRLKVPGQVSGLAGARRNESAVTLFTAVRATF